ncbi:MAG: FHA domain-containing protein [Gemmataceae bacterium]
MDVKLVIRAGAAKKRAFVMKEREMVIGRQKGCGLRIPAAAVSRQHCRLRIVAGVLQVEDLGSANGTVVNGVSLQSAALQPGDRLTVGPVTFEVQFSPADLEQAAAQEANTTDMPGLAPLDAPVAQDILAGLDADANAAENVEEDREKKKKKKKKEKREASPDYSVMMKDEGPYRMPNPENIRDLLSQLEDEAE